MDEVSYVNSSRTITDEIKNSDKNMKVKFNGMKRLMDTMESANEKRATEIGPVLEEILHSHWDRWGLNE